MTDLPSKALTFAEVAAWAREDLGALDAASAKLLNEFLATVPVRQRLAAVAVMRRRMAILSRIAGRVDSLEDDLCSSDTQQFMNRDQKIRLYGTMANREAAMLRQIESDDPALANPVIPVTGSEVVTPATPIPEIAAKRIVNAVESLGDALSRASVRRVSRPPLLVKWET